MTKQATALGRDSRKIESVSAVVELEQDAKKLTEHSQLLEWRGFVISKARQESLDASLGYNTHIHTLKHHFKNILQHRYHGQTYNRSFYEGGARNRAAKRNIGRGRGGPAGNPEPTRPPKASSAVDENVRNSERVCVCVCVESALF